MAFSKKGVPSFTIGGKNRYRDSLFQIRLLIVIFNPFIVPCTSLLNIVNHKRTLLYKEWKLITMGLFDHLHKTRNDKSLCNNIVMIGIVVFFLSQRRKCHNDETL